MHLPHLAAKRTTLSAFAAGLTIRTFSFTQGKTHALTATEKRNGRPADAGNRQKGAFTTWGKIRRDIAFAARETTRIQA
jgi:hypothetical protein